MDFELCEVYVISEKRETGNHLRKGQVIRYYANCTSGREKAKLLKFRRGDKIYTRMKRFITKALSRCLKLITPSFAFVLSHCVAIFPVLFEYRRFLLEGASLDIYDNFAIFSVLLLWNFPFDKCVRK